MTIIDKLRNSSHDINDNDMTKSGTGQPSQFSQCLVEEINDVFMFLMESLAKLQIKANPGAVRPVNSDPARCTQPLNL